MVAFNVGGARAVSGAVQAWGRKGGGGKYISNRMEPYGNVLVTRVLRTLALLYSTFYLGVGS